MGVSLWGHSPHTLDSAQTTGKRWIRAGLSRLAGNTPNPDQGCMTGSLPPGGHFLKGDPPKRGNPHLQKLPMEMKETPPESETRCSLFGAPARPQHLCSLGSGWAQGSGSQPAPLQPSTSRCNRGLHGTSRASSNSGGFTGLSAYSHGVGLCI